MPIKDQKSFQRGFFESVAFFHFTKKDFLCLILVKLQEFTEVMEFNTVRVIVQRQGNLKFYRTRDFR